MLLNTYLGKHPWWLPCNFRATIIHNLIFLLIFQDSEVFFMGASFITSSEHWELKPALLKAFKCRLTIYQITITQGVERGYYTLLLTLNLIHVLVGSFCTHSLSFVVLHSRTKLRAHRYLLPVQKCEPKVLACDDVPNVKKEKKMFKTNSWTKILFLERGARTMLINYILLRKRRYTCAETKWDRTVRCMQEDDSVADEKRIE